MEAGSNLSSTFANDSYDSGNGQLQKSKNNQYNVQVGIGYFIFGNFVIGVEPMLKYNITKGSDDKLTSTNLSVGPFLRYYVGKSKIKPLVQANLGFLSGNSKYTSIALSSNSKSNGLSYGGGLGVAFFANESISFDGIIGYSYSSTKSTDNNSNKTTQTSGDIGFSVGITICL
jgi:outer membrane protein